MDFIEEVLRLSSKSEKTSLICSISSIMFLVISWGLIIIIFNGSSLIGIMLFLGTLIAPILGAILGIKLGKMLQSNKKIHFQRTKLYKKMEKEGYLDEFMNTINEEINLENTIKYSSDIQGIGLIVTKTWFVYISNVRPVIAKTEDIIKISQEISTNNNRPFLCLEFKDKTYARIDHLIYDDIESKIKNKYPNIMIGIGIIEE